MSGEKAKEYIDKITNYYKGEVLFHVPYEGKKCSIIPEELYSILYISNGIAETMILPDSDEKIEISWIIYPHDMIIEQTEFYVETYNLNGTVFSEDGTGSPFIIKPDGMIICFNCIDNEETVVADSLLDFFQ